MSMRSILTLSLVAAFAVWAWAAPAAAATSGGSAAGGAAPACAGRSQFGILITGKTVALREHPSVNSRVVGALRQFAEVNACDLTSGESSYVRCGQRSVVWYRVAGRGGFVPATCTRLLFRLANQ
ncbi:hypothetical protein AB0K60_37075 [Thermopolyspora sp. NPDC052614]|uniref:hypothetical protein n=1 Tax=Thermopolyspora sp. NPDC052614 TaxID=3155682 RepID=UPI0034448727